MTSPSTPWSLRSGLLHSLAGNTTICYLIGSRWPTPVARRSPLCQRGENRRRHLSRSRPRCRDGTMVYPGNTRPETGWNAFRLANTAPEVGRAVETLPSRRRGGPDLDHGTSTPMECCSKTRPMVTSYSPAGWERTRARSRKPISAHSPPWLIASASRKPPSRFSRSAEPRAQRGTQSGPSTSAR